MKFQGTFEQRCLTTGAPTELSFLTTSLSIVFLLTNIPGNLLIILAVVLDPNKNLRSPFNWLIANLATADLIVGTITDPLSINIHIKEALDLTVTKGDLWGIHISYFISCTASVLSLSTLALERYLAIRKPHAYRNSFTTKRILFTVIGIWLISLSLPQIYFEVGYITYAFIFATTSVIVAIVITCSTYTLMLRKVKERTQNINVGNDNTIASYTIPRSCSAREPAASPNDMSINADSNPTTSETPNSVRNSARMIEAKVTKMFVVVLIALLCCYGPSTIMIYIMSFCKSCSCTTLHWFRDMQFLFVIMNSNVNFYCYALQSSRFRKAFGKILKLSKSREELNFSNINTHQILGNPSSTNSVELSEDSQPRNPNRMEILKVKGVTNPALLVDKTSDK